MLIGRIKNESTQNLQQNDIEIERVYVFKILGLHANDNLTWGDHQFAVNLLNGCTS